MKTAVVTGATGFLGRNLVDVLLKDNWSITVLHRRGSDLKKLTGCSVQFQEVDLYDAESTEKAIPEHTDAIFHVAGNTSHWALDANAQWKDNVLATRNLVNAALKKQVGRFIFTSTGATNSYENTDEHGANKIKNGYIRTKRLSELEVYRGVEKGLDAVILKPIIIIGKYDYSSYSQIYIDMKNNSFRPALPGKIAFCDAEDVALAHLAAYKKGRTCEHYVLGGAYASWLDLASEICRILQVPGPFVVPKWVLWPLAVVLNGVSYITRRPPLITPDLVRLLGDAPDVTYYEARKARLDLDYTSRPLSEMVRHCYDWLVQEKRL